MDWLKIFVVCCQKMSNSTLPSHMCVYFAKENSFQVIADRKGTFRNKDFANCLDPENNKWRVGEILKRGKYNNCKEIFSIINL